MFRFIGWGRRWASLAGVAGTLALAASASAEGRKHDGLYLSANGGLGYVTSSGESNPSKFSGVSTPLALWAGYTLGSVAIGGGVFTDGVWSPSYDYEGPEGQQEPDDGFALLGVAAFADIYPDPKGGFHIMPSVG